VVYKIFFVMIFLTRTANASRSLPAEKLESETKQQSAPGVETV
jgi:hypothetical protein